MDHKRKLAMLAAYETPKVLVHMRKLRTAVAARWRSASHRIRKTASFVRSPVFIAPLLLIVGMGLSVYATHLLAGQAWAVLVAASWCLLAGVVLLRGIEQ